MVSNEHDVADYPKYAIVIDCDRLWSIVINCDQLWSIVIMPIMQLQSSWLSPPTHPPGGNSIPLGVLAKLQHRSSCRRGRSDESSHQHLPCSLRKLYGCFCYLGPCQPTGIREKSKWTSVGPVYAFTQTRLIPIQELITCRASSAWSTSKTQPWPVESRLEPLLIWFSLHWVPSSWAVFQVHFMHFFWKILETKFWWIGLVSTLGYRYVTPYLTKKWKVCQMLKTHLPKKHKRWRTRAGWTTYTGCRVLWAVFSPSYLPPWLVLQCRLLILCWMVSVIDVHCSWFGRWWMPIAQCPWH